MPVSSNVPPSVQNPAISSVKSPNTNTAPLKDQNQGQSTDPSSLIPDIKNAPVKPPMNANGQPIQTSSLNSGD
jgi:hypothetical protein